MSQLTDNEVKELLKQFPCGVLNSPTDLRDYTYDMIACASIPITIPKSYCLDYNYPILSQGVIGSCVAHGLAEIKSYIDGTDFENMYSRGFIYANRNSNDSQNIGMIPRQALKHLVDEGCCLYNSFPINEEYPSIVTTLNNYGKDKLYNEAKLHKSSAYLKLNVSEIKEYLVTQGKPVLIVCKVYDNFYESLTNGGIIPSIKSGSLKGSHAMIVIGFDSDQLIIVNSWGESYGNKGKLYLDVNSSIISECWVLEDIKNIKRPVIKTYKIGWNKEVINNTTKWTYSNDGTTLVKNAWIQPNNTDWYYIGSDNYAYNSQWLQYKNSWYFFEKDTCKMCASTWILWKDKWYYLLDNGIMAMSQWREYGNDKYYVDNNGVMLTGIQNISGKFYEFDSNGALIKTY